MASDDPVHRSDELDQRLQNAPVITSLIQTGRTNRRLIKWVAVSVAFDVLLSIGFGVFAVQAHRAAAQATSARAQARINCLAGNQARQLDRQLWDYVLGFPPPPDETAAQLQRRAASTAQFRAYIARVFAPRDCDHLNTPATGTPVPVPTPTPSPSPSVGGGSGLGVGTVQPQFSAVPMSSPSPTPTRASPSVVLTPPPRSPSPIVRICVGRICVV